MDQRSLDPSFRARDANASARRLYERSARIRISTNHRQIDQPSDNDESSFLLSIEILRDFLFEDRFINDIIGYNFLKGDRLLGKWVNAKFLVITNYAQA